VEALLICDCRLFGRGAQQNNTTDGWWAAPQARRSNTILPWMANTYPNGQMAQKSACENFHDHATFCALRAETGRGMARWGTASPALCSLKRT